MSRVQEWGVEYQEDSRVSSRGCPTLVSRTCFQFFDFGFRGSGFEFQNPDAGFRVLGSTLQVHDSRFQISGAGFRIPGSR